MKTKIAVANFLYCCVTLGLVVLQYRSREIPGLIIFLRRSPWFSS